MTERSSHREDTELQAECLSGPGGDVWRPVKSENTCPGPKTTENFKTEKAEHQAKHEALLTRGPCVSTQATGPGDRPGLRA